MTARRASRARYRRRVIIGIVGIVVLVLVPVGVLLVTTDFNILHPAVAEEARDNAVQLLLAGFLGAALTAAIALVANAIESERQTAEIELERQRHDNLVTRQQDERDYEYRLRFLRKVTTAYNQVKTVRRTLRAHGFASPVTEWTDSQRAAFFVQMALLNEAQLRFETSKREARVRSAVFDRAGAGTNRVAPFYDQIETHLESIDLYLNRIVDEWETKDQTSRPALAAFLASPDLPGGLRAGWEGQKGGPSTHLRNMETLLAESDPRIKKAPPAISEHFLDGA